MTVNAILFLKTNDLLSLFPTVKFNRIAHNLLMVKSGVLSDKVVGNMLQKPVFPYVGEIGITNKEVFEEERRGMENKLRLDDLCLLYTLPMLT